MKKGWEMKRLGDVCHKITDGSHNPPKGIDKSNYLMISSKNINNDSIDFREPRYLTEMDFLQENKRTNVTIGDVLLTIVGTIGRVAIVTEEKPMFTLQRSVAVLKPKHEKLDSRFLMFSLHNSVENLVSKARGVAQKGLYLNQIKELDILLPLLQEQQRIVSILDKAFDEIEKVKKLTEENLKNAKELFESYLQGVFENKGENWEEKTLGECFKLKSGENITAKMMIENGEYPVYGGNGIAGRYGKYNLSGNNVIIGRVGALCGNVRHIKEPIWLTDNGFKITDYNFEFDNAFLTYLLNYKKLRSYARQAAQPVISNSSLEGVLLSFPKPLQEQQSIVKKLDKLSAKTKRLETIYQQKLDRLEELKKSILQKAFQGEL